jgi:hypothetical protein
MHKRINRVRSINSLMRCRSGATALVHTGCHDETPLGRCL